MTGLGDGAVLRLLAGGAALTDEEAAALVAAVDTVVSGRGGAGRGGAGCQSGAPAAPVDGWRRAARLEGLGAPRVAGLADLRARRP